MLKKMSFARSARVLPALSVLAASALASCGGGNDGGLTNTGYQQKNLVASNGSYGAQFVFSDFVDAWGIATRPAGAGGHFWIAASGKSFEFVGDVLQSSTPALRSLFQDGNPSEVATPAVNGGVATGMVFNSGSNFVITQQIAGRPDVTAPARFITVSDAGVVSAWTERRNDDGSFDRSGVFDTVIDRSSQGSKFFGAAISPNQDRLYVADFGTSAQVRVYDGRFQPLAISFDQPFDLNGNGRVDPGEFTPFNIQTLKRPDGVSSVFIAYARAQACTPDAMALGVCAQGEILPGEEGSVDADAEGDRPNNGRVAEFTADGKLIKVWGGGEAMNSAWGMAFAPSNFGPLSNALLVGSFGGSGRIAALDSSTTRFIGFMQTSANKPVQIQGLWGLQFGNGASLGDANALYFAAGPNDENDGLFGSLRF